MGNFDDYGIIKVPEEVISKIDTAINNLTDKGRLEDMELDIAA